LILHRIIIYVKIRQNKHKKKMWDGIKTVNKYGNLKKASD